MLIKQKYFIKPCSMYYLVMISFLSDISTVFQIEEKSPRNMEGTGKGSFNTKQKTSFSVYYCKIKKTMHSNMLSEI